jgi:uncharacterized protein YjbI with pentapeptide repeats
MQAMRSLTAALFVCTSVAHADIFQWEYVNPVNPSQGKRQSTTLAPDGDGVDAAPRADFSNRNLTAAYLIGADLTGASVNSTDLTNADLSRADLSDAIFQGATLAGADFVDAKIQRANFGYTAITPAQLYSTASYQANDLTGVDFSLNDLNGWNFGGQNLTNASFFAAALKGADFTLADVRGASFTRGSDPGISLAQLYSTASYQARDLSGIGLAWANLADGNFVGQNLTTANLANATFVGSNFREAILTNANFGYLDIFCGCFRASVVIGADLTAADARGATGFSFYETTMANLIRPDGHIGGLSLGTGALLIVRDYDGNPAPTPYRHLPFYPAPSSIPPIPITVDQHLAMVPGGTLRMVFEEDSWDSTISFAPGIPVALGGTLELTFAADVNLTSQIGRSFDLFDWTGVAPTGAFTILSHYAWDLSHLYDAGEVTLLSIPEPSTSALLTVCALGVTVHRRGRMPKQSVVIMTFLVSLVSASWLHAADLRTVALTGQQAAGAPAGVIYESFGAELAQDSFAHGVALNDAGQTAFRANLAGNGVDFTNDQGVWSEGSGSLALVARTGSQAPGAPVGVNFRTDPTLELFTPVLNNAGKTAFYATTTDGGLGLWSEGAGALAPVARSGQQAPGAPAGVTLTFSNLHEILESPILNDAGETIFRSDLAGHGVTSENDFGLWIQGSGGLELRARKGSQAPGLPPGANYGAIAPAGLNDSGQIIFASLLSGSGVNSGNNKGVWSDVSGSLTLVARKGNQASDLPSGVTFNDLVDTGAINNAGQVAFVPGLSNQGSSHTQDSIFFYNSGSMTPLLVRGDHPPGTPAGVTYEGFGFWPALNEAGQALTGALLAGSGVDASNQLAVFLSDAAGNEELILRSGDPAPDVPPGVVFHATFDSFAEGALNDRGQVAIGQGLAGAGVNSSNDFGIWATDFSGVLQLVAREGDALEVAPGDFRTISALNRTDHNANSNGWPSAFNNFGQLAFWASFTDGTQGVFVSNAVAQIPGDFNHDGIVDAADLSQWQGDFGLNADSDADHDGDSDGADFLIWQRQLSSGFGDYSVVDTVPESASWSLLVFALAGLNNWLRSPPRRQDGATELGAQDEPTWAPPNLVAPRQSFENSSRK